MVGEIETRQIAVSSERPILVRISAPNSDVEIWVELGQEPAAKLFLFANVG